MTMATKNLWLGAVKSAVSQATGLIIALPVVDAEHFSVQQWGGWKHILTAILITVIVAEARFWKQWADAATGKNGTPPQPPTVQ